MTKVEVEAKFEIPDRPVFDRLLAVERLAGLAVGERTINKVTDNYLDTPDWMILAAGYACRVRDGEAERVLTLKSVGHVDGAIQQRDEYEAPLDPDAPIWDESRWPAGPGRTLVEKAIADKTMETHLTLRQTRHVCPLLDRDRQVAELSLDEVCFENNDLILELEVELSTTGTAAELEQIARVLEDEWKLTPASLSKLERGLQIRQKTRQGPLSETERKRAKREKTKYVDIRSDDPMSKAGRKTLRLHFERMLAHKAGTRLGEDIEELHDMRVAIRRMRAAFRLFGPYFDPKTIQPYLKGLRQAGRALGPVRDLDVFEEKAQQYLATLPTDQADALDSLLTVWQIERVSAREQMLTFLDSRRFSRFLKRFDRFLSTEGVGALPAVEGFPDQVQTIAPQLIDARYKAVRAYEPLLDSASIELLHALRIDFKRLRYALEFFVPVLGEKSKTVIADIKRMQDHLGDLNDADVAIRLLHDFLARNPRGQEGLVNYLRNREAERDRLVESFPAAWERYTRPKVRCNLTLAMAALG